MPVIGGTGPAIFQDVSEHEEGHIYFHGSWDVGGEHTRHSRATLDLEDYAAIKYMARSVHVVVRPTTNEPFKVAATRDGRPIPQADRGDDIRVDDLGNTYLLVDTPRLYTVIRSSAVATGELRLATNSPDFLLYTYTFVA